ncbi:hypothetical protein V8C86DRAFT_2610170 [Haematococcus lacustris]
MKSPCPPQWTHQFDGLDFATFEAVRLANTAAKWKAARHAGWELEDNNQQMPASSKQATHASLDFFMPIPACFAAATSPPQRCLFATSGSIVSSRGSVWVRSGPTGASMPLAATGKALSEVASAPPPVPDPTVAGSKPQPLPSLVVTAPLQDVVEVSATPLPPPTPRPAGSRPMQPRRDNLILPAHSPAPLHHTAASSPSPCQPSPPSQTWGSAPVEQHAATGAAVVGLQQQSDSSGRRDSRSTGSNGGAATAALEELGAGATGAALQDLLTQLLPVPQETSVPPSPPSHPPSRPSRPSSRAAGMPVLRAGAGGPLHPTRWHRPDQPCSLPLPLTQQHPPPPAAKATPSQSACLPDPQPACLPSRPAACLPDPPSPKPLQARQAARHLPAADSQLPVHLPVTSSPQPSAPAPHDAEPPLAPHPPSQGLAPAPAGTATGVGAAVRTLSRHSKQLQATACAVQAEQLAVSHGASSSGILRLPPVMPHAVVNTAAGGPAGAGVARPMPRSQQVSVTPQTPKALPRASLPQAAAQGLPTLVRCSAGPGRQAGQSR